MLAPKYEKAAGRAALLVTGMRILFAALALSLAAPAMAQQPTYPTMTYPLAYVDHMHQCAEIVRGREIQAKHPTTNHWLESPCRDVPADRIDAIYKMVGPLSYPR